VLAHQNQVVMAETLEGGLGLLFGSGAGQLPTSTVATEMPAPVPGAPATAVSPATLRQLVEIYDRATAAQRAGNWAAYGEEMSRLGELLRRLSQTTTPP